MTESHRRRCAPSRPYSPDVRGCDGSTLFFVNGAFHGELRGLLHTVDEIRAALREIASDQVDVIESVAGMRGVGDDEMEHIEMWRAMIEEEADASLACANEDDYDVQFEYALKLFRIAARIL